jgi:hypothetical protein
MVNLVYNRFVLNYSRILTEFFSRKCCGGHGVIFSFVFFIIKNMYSGLIVCLFKGTFDRRHRADLLGLPHLQVTNRTLKFICGCLTM